MSKRNKKADLRRLSQVGSRWRRRGLEPLTCTLRMQRHPDVSVASKGLTPTPSVACTNACTSKPENANAYPPEAGHKDQGEGTAAGTLDVDPETPAGDQGGTGRGSSAADQDQDQGDPLTKLAAASVDLTPADQGTTGSDAHH